MGSSTSTVQGTFVALTDKSEITFPTPTKFTLKEWLTIRRQIEIAYLPKNLGKLQDQRMQAILDKWNEKCLSTEDKIEMWCHSEINEAIETNNIAYSSFAEAYNAITTDKDRRKRGSIRDVLNPYLEKCNELNDTYIKQRDLIDSTSFVYSKGVIRASQVAFKKSFWLKNIDGMIREDSCDGATELIETIENDIYPSFGSSSNVETTLREEISEMEDLRNANRTIFVDLARILQEGLADVRRMSADDKPSFKRKFNHDIILSSYLEFCVRKNFSTELNRLYANLAAALAPNVVVGTTKVPVGDIVSVWGSLKYFYKWAIDNFNLDSLSYLVDRFPDPGSTSGLKINLIGRTNYEGLFRRYIVGGADNDGNSLQINIAGVNALEKEPNAAAAGLDDESAWVEIDKKIIAGLGEPYRRMSDKDYKWLKVNYDVYSTAGSIADTFKGML